MFKITNGMDYLEIDIIEDNHQPNNGYRVFINVKSYRYVGQHDFFCTKNVIKEFCKKLLILEKSGNGFAKIKAEKHWDLSMDLYMTLTHGFLVITGSLIKFVHSDCDIYEQYLKYGFHTSRKMLTSLTEQTWVRKFADIVLE